MYAVQLERLFDAFLSERASNGTGATVRNIMIMNDDETHGVCETNTFKYQTGSADVSVSQKLGTSLSESYISSLWVCEAEYRY